jgi:hypothetical protein
MSLKVTKQEKEEALIRLRKLCLPGTVVYTVLRHVSRSGMYRAIDLYVIQENQPIWISGFVAKVGGFKFDTKYEAVGVGGCGMDMGFAIVNALCYTLHGFETVGEDAKKAEGRPFVPTPTQYRAGYSLIQRWM